MNSKDSETLKKGIAAGRYCFIFLIILFLAVHWLQLGTLLLTILFAYFLLDKLTVFKSRWLTIATFMTLVVVVFFGLAYFIAQAIRTLPHIVTISIPIIFQHAKEYGIELPFSDWDSLKDFALEGVKGQLLFIGNFANEATRQTIFVIIGIVIAVGIFIDSAVTTDRNLAERKKDLYSVLEYEIISRFHSLYASFRKVMGAQLIISGINTALTSIFVISFSFPHAPMAIAITFLCGLLPIVGNLISNSMIVGIGLTVSPKLGLFALIFLILLHKLEYFLNSKIIGHRIKNPVWLTLIALLVGERLLGITGMILAPVVLHFIKMETSKVQLET